MALKYCKLPHGGFGAITRDGGHHPGQQVTIDTKGGKSHERVLAERLYQHGSASVFLLEDRAS